MLKPAERTPQLTVALGGLPTDAKGIRFTVGEMSSPHQSVAENVMLGLEPTRFGIVRERELERRAARHLSVLGWHGDLKRQLGGLSVVDRRIIELARALAKADAARAEQLLIDDTVDELGPADNARWQDAVALASEEIPIVLAVSTLHGVNPGLDRVLVVRDGREAASIDPTDGEALEAALELRHTPRRHPRRPPGEIVLAVRDLTVQHPVQARRSVFGSIDLDARAGTVTGLAGPHALELLMSLFARSYGEVSAGRILLAGTDVTRLSREASAALGLVFTTEHPPSYDVGLIGGVPSRVSAERLRALARNGMIDASRDYRPSTRASIVQSIGTQRPPTKDQFDALLESFVTGPARAVLLGEPLLGLDATERTARLDVLDRIAAAGKAVIVSASPDDLAEIADEVVVISRGHVFSRLRTAEISAGRIRRELLV
ncbi:ABC-type sugar transport system, ATPase component [Paramicrobacterium humi]|uniref:ABC-type sugar transport system, ATPase component n=1 Tax=Paramicrobacterium humi TaxID=640635 RepID=A0A1H4J6L6_9MICO|nr:hypothetical protein [Microbacterium humi]SEB41851.1 ABC-type sugar transport system, ATPase component [Microbacterium humi]